MVTGYFTVPGPTVEPYRFGLLAAASDVVTDEPGPDLDPHWRLGVQYESEGCVSGGIWDPRCGDVFTVVLTRTANANEFSVNFTPDVGPYGASINGGAEAPMLDGATFVEATNPFDAVFRETGPQSMGRSITITGIDPTSAQGTTFTGTSSPFADNEPKTAEGLSVRTSEAFVVYAGIDCRIVGFNDPAGQATRRLQSVERRLVEQHVWEQQIAIASAVFPTGDATAVSLKEGIAALEEALGDTYGGIGIIHSPEWLTPYLSDRQQIWRDGSVLRTSLGTKWAFGRGYTNTGPDGTEAAEGTAWLYATGNAFIRRSEVLPPVAPDRGATNLAINNALVIAERVYVVMLDCPLFAVHVTLEGE